jgi:hypothetical protein
MAPYRSPIELNRQPLLKNLSVGSIACWLREQARLPDRNTRTRLGSGKFLQKQTSYAIENVSGAPLSW